MTVVVEPAALTAWRAWQLYRHPERAVRTLTAARAFVEAVGFAFTFPERTVTAPDLWSAVNGGERALPEHLDDPALDRTWEWKDRLPAERQVVYGRFLRGKPTLVARWCWPLLVAASPQAIDPEEWEASYAEGRLSADARRVYAVLLDRGPLSKPALRRAAGLDRAGAAPRLDRALADLQRAFLVGVVGVSDDNAWRYCFVYGALSQWVPDLLAQAATIGGQTAMERLLDHYLRLVGAATPAAIVRLFGWPPTLLERRLARLLTTGQLVAVAVAGQSGWVAHPDFLRAGGCQ